jgi:hypothetical protein
VKIVVKLQDHRARFGDGFAFGVGALSDATGVSERTIQRLRPELRAQGIISHPGGITVDNQRRLTTWFGQGLLLPPFKSKISEIPSSESENIRDFSTFGDKGAISSPLHPGAA